MLSATLRSLTRLAGVTFAACFLASPAAGMTFIYDWDAADGTAGIALNRKAGDLQSLTVSFDDVSEVVNFEMIISPRGNNLLPDGGWLVVSDGPSPLSNADEWAIYYLDRISGNLTAYVYDGNDAETSWKQQPFLEGFPGGTQASIAGNGNLTMGFSIDASAINAAGISPIWKGTNFSDEVGVWFHPTRGTEAVYGDDGSLISWRTGVDGFFDGLEPFQTSQVPEPAAGLLAGLAGVALLVARRRASRRG